MKKGEKRKLLQDLTIRTATSIGTIPAGEFIEIQQDIDRYGNVLVHNVWHYAPTIRKISEPYEEANNDAQTK